MYKHQKKYYTNNKDQISEWRTKRRAYRLKKIDKFIYNIEPLFDNAPTLKKKSIIYDAIIIIFDQDFHTTPNTTYNDIVEIFNDHCNNKPELKEQFLVNQKEEIKNEQIESDITQNKD